MRAIGGSRNASESGEEMQGRWNREDRHRVRERVQGATLLHLSPPAAALGPQMHALVDIAHQQLTAQHAVRE
jgi:hypothetical protein